MSELFGCGCGRMQPGANLSPPTTKSKIHLDQATAYNKLSMAVQKGNYRDVITLLELKANPNLVDTHDKEQPTLAGSGYGGSCDSALHQPVLLTAVEHASGSDREQHIIEALLQVQADVNKAAGNGLTPLLFAVQQPKTACLQTLLRQEAQKLLINKADSRGRTAVYAATDCDNVDGLSALLAHKASVNQADSDGCTPAHLAVWMNRPDALQCLMAHRADINQADARGQTPLLTATVMCCTKGNAWVPLVETLLMNNVSVDQADRDGFTPIHIAVNEPSDDNVVRALLASRANPNRKDSYGCTAVWTAAQQDSNDALSLLIASRGDINVADGHGRTPLHVAAYENSTGALQTLLDCNASVSQQDNNGCTALKYAEDSENATIESQYLLRTILEGRKIPAHP